MTVTKSVKRQRRQTRAYNRKDGARTPSGQLSRSGEQTEQERKRQEKERMQTVVDARMRHYGVSEKRAALTECGSSLGRLKMARAITERQFRAGEVYGETVQRYHALSGVPHPSPRAQDYGRAAGRGTEAPDHAAITAAVSRYMGALKALQSYDVSGRPRYRTVTDVVVMDYPADNWPAHMVGHLRGGLDALAAYFGLGAIEGDALPGSNPPAAKQPLDMPAPTAHG